MRICVTRDVALITICAFFLVFSWIQIGEGSEKEESLFSLNDPISGLLLTTFFLPVHLLDSKTIVEPELTDEQNSLYNMEAIPITLDRDIRLLTGKESGKVEYFWSEKDEDWQKPENAVYDYLQARYDKRDALIEEASRHRQIKSLQKRLNEMSGSRMGVKSETRSR
ncbi:MAG: hypothetical protein ABID09_04130 [Candidatus Omnitrophota bacterium]